MKKKGITLVVCFILLITSLVTAFAQPDKIILNQEETLALFGGEEGLIDVQMNENTLYMLFANALYAYTLGEEAPQELIGPQAFEQVAEVLTAVFNKGQEETETGLERAFDSLFIWHNRLYALSVTAHSAIPVDTQAGVFLPNDIITLDFLNQEDAYTLRVKGVLGDQLFAHSMMPGAKLFSINLTTQEKTEYESQNIQDLYPAGENEWLALVYDQQELYSQPEPTYSLMVFNPKEDKLTDEVKVSATGTGGFACSSEDYALYYLKEGQITHLDEKGEEKPVGYMDIQRVNARGKAWVKGNVYIVWPGTGEGILIEAINPDVKLPPVLNILGNSYGREKVDKAFKEKYPGVVIRYRSSSPTTNLQQWIPQVIQSKQDDIDIFFVDGYFVDIENLFKKEYALSLSSSEIITKQVSRMYPYAQKALTHNGQIYGLLEDHTALYPRLAYSKEVWDGVGLTQEDVPKTLMEFVDLAARWEEELKQENKGYFFMNGAAELGRSDLVFRIVEHYIMDYQKRGVTLDFDTPLFREMMEKIENMNLSAYGEPGHDGDEGKALFNSGAMDVLYSGNQKEWEGLYPPPDEGLEPAIALGSSIAFINPNSPRKAEALAYFEIMAENYSPKAQITLFEDVNDPVIDENREKDLAQKQEELVGLKEVLDAAQEAEKGAIQEQITLLEEALLRGEQSQWLVSPEAIEQFNQLVPYAFIPLNETFYSAGNEEEGNRGTVELLLNNYIEGAIDLDNFIKEVNRRVQMHALENE